MSPSQDRQKVLGDWYANHYSELTATADGSFFARYMHQAMERRYGAEDVFARVLEVGGNRGEHVPFVRHQFSEYVLTDLRAPDVIDEVARDPRVKPAVCDVAALPYPDGQFDRVIATCLLHHVDSPFDAAGEMRRVTRPGGVLTILVPTDPGLAYRVGKSLTSGRAARRAGMGDSHRLIGALDHRNHFLSIKEQLRYVFRDDELAVDWLPWRVPIAGLNAFTVFTVRRSAQD